MALSTSVSEVNTRMVEREGDVLNAKRISITHTPGIEGRRRRWDTTNEVYRVLRFPVFLVPVWLTFRQDVELVFRVSERRRQERPDGEVSHERIKPDTGYVTRRVELSDISSNESRDSI